MRYLRDGRGASLMLDGGAGGRIMSVAEDATGAIWRLLTMVRVRNRSTNWPAASVTRILTLTVPALIGVPVIAALQRPGEVRHHDTDHGDQGLVRDLPAQDADDGHTDQCLVDPDRPPDSAHCPNPHARYPYRRTTPQQQR